MNSLKKLGYDIKVFDYNSEEVKFVKNDCLEHFESKSISIRTDAIRMFILSQYSDYLYLDWDVYVHEPFELKEKVIRPYFWSIYNAEELDYFKVLYEQYKLGLFKNLYDAEVSKILNIKDNGTINELNHLYSADRPYYLFSNNQDTATKYAHSKVCVINNGENILRNAINIKGDKELFDFLSSLKRIHVYE
jgi:hypothetical protein